MSTSDEQVSGTHSKPVNSSSSATVAMSSTKTMQQLLNEIEQVNIDAKESIKTLEKIDTRPKKAITNRDRSVEGRRELKTLTERINHLEQQMNAMTKESDPNWPIKKFDKSKQNALKTLSDLSNKLKQVDKHLEKATETTPVNDQSSVVPTTSNQNENAIGFGAFLSKFSFNKTKKPASSTTAVPKKPSSSSSESTDETTSDEEGSKEKNDDDNHTANRKQKASNTSRSASSTEYSSDENEDDVNENRQISNEIQSKKLQDDTSKHRDTNESSSQTSSSSSSTHKQLPITKVPSTRSSLPIVRKTTIASTSTSSSHDKASSPQEQRIKNDDANQDGSYETEEEEEDDDDDDDNDKLKRLQKSSKEEKSPSDDEQTEDDKSTTVNAHLQELRMGTYSPGTQFRVLHDLEALQTGDLTIHKGEILILVQQNPDDWWLFKNPQTQEQGTVPINHIQLQFGTSDKKLRHRIKQITSPSTFVDALKTKNYIPSGFIVSDLASLTQHNQYKLSHTLIPKMSESNFTFTDLNWRHDTDQIYLEEVKYQKILRIQKCSKIPRIKGQQVNVLCRCIRICLYDGFKIISNIHAIRAHISNKIDERDLTEDWCFAVNNENTFIDEQAKLLIRSNEFDPSKHLHLLIELSQLCQLKDNNEKCEIGCGWIMIPFDDDQFSMISEKKKYNELLHGGHYDELNILLDSEYKKFSMDGLSGRFNRNKQARIRFSLESRETDIDLLYDNLPVTSMIVPINLIRILFFYRNELAYQLEKRYHSYNLSTMPLDSIFLSTFYQTLEQPDLIYTLNKLYLPKELNYRQQREEFLNIYESFIYPLLYHCKLSSYDFQNESKMNERRKLIKEMINKQLAANKNHKPDILAILLDSTLTDQWKPFKTDEICFSLQKNFYNITS
ncbi:unnamed protein product [Rotaria sp. Silwood1]|nr:unnamed protein product [Rotaria sp. Silwood1]CAF4637861.1 unnamed protein product [Rotaria sp. Silwood1]